MSSPKTKRRIQKQPGRAAHGSAAPTCSAFRAWFETQHGIRPYPRGEDDVLAREVATGEWAAKILARAREWDAKETAALLAWTAKDCSEEEIMRRLPNGDLSHADNALKQKENSHGK